MVAKKGVAESKIPPTNTAWPRGSKKLDSSGIRLSKELDEAPTSTPLPFRELEPSGKAGDPVLSPQSQRPPPRQRLKTQPSLSKGMILGLDDDQARRAASALTANSHPMKLELRSWLNDMLHIPGAFAAAVVDLDSGLLLAKKSARALFDIETAALESAKAFQAELGLLKALGVAAEPLHDIIVSIDNDETFVMTPPPARAQGAKEAAGADTDATATRWEHWMFFVAVDLKEGNLGLTRYRVSVSFDFLRMAPPDLES